jgi:hypothetical protein
MTEHRGYECDGGCGATVVLHGVADTLARHGWFTTFGPEGGKTLHCCSRTCLHMALTNHYEVDLPAVT